MSDDPFAALGLPARAGLSDEDVRAAWRRIAAATHPDRDDGGDPARFSAAAAAYDTLRTSFGRGEALADLGPPGPGPRAGGRRGARSAPHSASPLSARHARPAGRGTWPWPWAGVNWYWRRLALRACAAAGGLTVALLAAGWTPATVGLLAGALTWVGAAGWPLLRGQGEG